MPNGLLLRCMNADCDHSVMILMGTGSVAQDMIRDRNYDEILNQFPGDGRRKVEQLLAEGYTIEDLPYLPFYCPDCDLLNSGWLCIMKKGQTGAIVRTHCPNCGKETPSVDFKPGKDNPASLDIEVAGKTIRYKCPKCRGDTFKTSPMDWD